MNAIMKTTHMLCAPLLLCAVFGAAQAQQRAEGLQSGARVIHLRPARP